MVQRWSESGRNFRFRRAPVATPVVVAGQVNVFPFQRREMYQQHLRPSKFYQQLPKLLQYHPQKGIFFAVRVNFFTIEATRHLL